jgi:hypothetical protein
MQNDYIEDVENHRLRRRPHVLGKPISSHEPETSQPVHIAEKQEQQVGSKSRILC